jgi:catechol 2,3-dioxygenase-like lactoylglutathione lyase family enzyme
MEAVTFGEGRHALRFGDSKINLHLAGHEFEPKADRSTPGSADLCLLTDVDVTNVVAELQRHGVVIDQGPVERTGARGTLISVYVRDPDANLIELSQYLPDP